MKRLLTSKEIKNILDFIKPEVSIPLDTAMSIVNLNKTSLRNQLKSVMIYPTEIPKLSELIEKAYHSSQMQAGESVGVICAQSIGEKQTQTNLNSFHSAGISEKTMTSGAPRFQELINATRRPRCVNQKIYFNKKHITIQDLRDTVRDTIVGLQFKDISISITVELNKKKEKWYDSYSILYNNTFMDFDHCVSFHLDMNKVYEFKISLQKIAEYIHGEFDDLHCVASPSSEGRIDIFVDCSNIELPEERICFIDKGDAVNVYLEECVQPSLEKINLCGIPGISEVFYVREGDEWIVETNGTNSRRIKTAFINFKKLLALGSVDENRTVSNNVWDIYEVLGIEAARQFLIEEFMNILEGINTCHPYLLVDRMTHNGIISSITRYTMKKDECGPFQKCSFEETMDNFLLAAARGEREPTKGVSASIICGKRAMIGTGMIGLKVDINNLPMGQPNREAAEPHSVRQATVDLGSLDEECLFSPSLSPIEPLIPKLQMIEI